MIEYKNEAAAQRGAAAPGHPSPLWVEDASMHELFSVNGTVTVRDVCFKFLFHTWRKYSKDALKERQRILTVLCADLGTKPVADCIPLDLLDWLRAHPEWRKASTIRGTTAIVKRVFAWAAKFGLIPKSPFAGIANEDLPLPEKEEPRRSMTPAEFRLLCIHTDRRFRRWLRFLWFTGARPGEACKLTWPMIDWKNGLATILDHKTAKKTGKARQIPIPARLLRLLRAMHSRDVRQGHSQDYVFRTTRESKWTRWYVSTKMQRLRPRAGVASDCVPYCARHAFGSAGAMLLPIKLVSVAMGHCDSKVTERYYTHLEGETERLRSVSEAIEAARRNH